MTPPVPNWHLKNAAETAGAMGVDALRGLSTEQVCTLAKQYGPNHIAIEKNSSLLSLAWAQINDFMVLVLVAAALLSGLMGDWQDALVIVVIVVLNASVGIVQFWRADRALASLRSLCSPEAKVLRDGQTMRVPSADLVPGDIVILEAGQQVPADLRLIESAQLKIDPAQKISIVQALQDQGEFVAMTDDGINDAPALRHANIGVAMGKNGTDVAREAARLVLLDDNFATIVHAVREGRRLYDNIRKFVRYAMTGNSGEIWAIALAPMLLMPTPLLPIHILWVNLVTDGLPGLALASEPAEQGIMQRAPRPPSESLFAHGMWQHILGIGGPCLAVQAWALSVGNAHAQTIVFTVLTLSQMAHLLAIRSETTTLWQLGLLNNKPLLAAVLLSFALQMATVYVPALNPLLKTQALNPYELGLCLAAAGTVWLVVETEKYWRRRRQWHSTLVGVKHPASNAPTGSPPQ